MNNDFCHVELSTDNVDKAKDFYGKLFSWKFETMNMGDGKQYTTIQPGSGPGGGMMQKPMPDVPTMWLTYVQVDNVDATVEKARKMGGTIIVPKMPVTDMGHFAIIQDPTGGVFGVWASLPKK